MSPTSEVPVLNGSNFFMFLYIGYITFLAILAGKRNLLSLLGKVKGSPYHEREWVPVIQVLNHLLETTFVRTINCIILGNEYGGLWIFYCPVLLMVTPMLN